MDASRFRERLLDGRSRIGIWGTGFIGYSTMATFSDVGIRSIGYDVDADRVDTINDGVVPIDTLEHWLGMDPAPLIDEDVMHATTDYTDLTSGEVSVHFVAIPTEKDGDPWSGPLETVLERISETDPTTLEGPMVVIVESTLTPGMTDRVVIPALEASPLTLGEDVLLGVAPRRDWFTSANKDLRKVPRVYGARTPEAAAYVREILDLVCENLVEASDHHHAEIVKSVENAYRHVGIALANQLSRAYPNTDVREVLELAATKWNIPAYFPSVGVGGYCIPVASKYVMNGAEHPEELTLLEETVDVDRTQPKLVAAALADHGIDTAAILGLAYKGDIKIDILSPTKAIAEHLDERGVDVLVNDPYFDDDYVREATGAEPAAFPEGLDGVDAAVVVADHRQYRYTPHSRITAALSDTTVVIDNPKVWNDVPFDEYGVEYYFSGAAGWLDGRTTTVAAPADR